MAQLLTHTNCNYPKLKKDDAMDRNTVGLLRKHELTHKNRCTENSQTTFTYYFFPPKMLMPNSVLPGQVLCMQILPSYRAPGDLIPESRELPNQWKSWRICWWWQWFPTGPGRAVPAEGACEQRRARSVLFSWRRSRACTPPADLKTQQSFIIKLIIPFRKNVF